MYVSTYERMYIFVPYCIYCNVLYVYFCALQACCHCWRNTNVSAVQRPGRASFAYNHVTWLPVNLLNPSCSSFGHEYDKKTRSPSPLEPGDLVTSLNPSTPSKCFQEEPSASDDAPSSVLQGEPSAAKDAAPTPRSKPIPWALRNLAATLQRARSGRAPRRPNSTDTRMPIRSCDSILSQTDCSVTVTSFYRLTFPSSLSWLLTPPPNSFQSEVHLSKHAPPLTLINYHVFM